MKNKDHPSVAQIRAARSLLNIHQRDLADACAISRGGMNLIETEKRTPNPSTIKKITEFFWEQGIEFTQDDGVKRRNDLVQLISGSDSGIELWDDICGTLKGIIGEVLISGSNERRVYDADPESIESHLKRLKNEKINERLLISEEDPFFLINAKFYRCLPKDIFKLAMPTFIYGDKVAFKFWKSQSVVIIHNKEIADNERQQFEFMWRNSTKPLVPEGYKYPFPDLL